MLLKLAWRNVWRNKRRSIITISAVVFAVMLSIVMRGIQHGTYALNIKSAVEIFSGYLQVQKTGYQKNRTLQKSFRVDDDLRKILDDTPAIKGYAPRIMGDGLISFRDNSQGAAILAVDPAYEKDTFTIIEKVREGAIFSSDSSQDIVVGYKLLDNLQASIGDTVVILSQGFDGSLGNLKFRISGILKTGAIDFDRRAVLMGLRTAQDLLTMYGRINLLAISLDDLEAVPSVEKSVAAKLQGSDREILNWREIMPGLDQNMKLDEVGGILFLGILVLVVAFGIMNTVMMSVTERFREFGVSLSIGMPYRKLVALVFLETVFIVLIGLIIGNLIAGGINYYIVENPIIFTGDFAALYEEYGFLPRLESSLKSSVFLDASLMIFIVSVLMSLYPIFKVYKLEPLKGIRYT